MSNLVGSLNLLSSMPQQIRPLGIGDRSSKIYESSMLLAEQVGGEEHKGDTA